MLNHFRPQLLLIVALAFANSCTNNTNMNTPAKLIPLKDFFRNPERSAYSLSPDGQYYAFLANYESRKNIFVQKVGTKEEPKRLTSVTDRDIWGCFGKATKKSCISAILAATKISTSFPWASTAATERPHPFPGVRTNIIDDLEEQDGIMIVGLNKRNPEILTLIA